MYVLRLYPYYFGTVYIPTFNLQVFLNGLSRKIQPVFMYSGYLNYQARESRKGLLNQHSQRHTLFWLQMESLKTCTHDICWSDLFLIPFRFCTTTSLFDKGLVRLLFWCAAVLTCSPDCTCLSCIFVWHKRHDVVQYVLFKKC